MYMIHSVKTQNPTHPHFKNILFKEMKYSNFIFKNIWKPLPQLGDRDKQVKNVRRLKRWFIGKPCATQVWEPSSDQQNRKDTGREDKKGGGREGERLRREEGKGREGKRIGEEIPGRLRKEGGKIGEGEEETKGKWGDRETDGRREKGKEGGKREYLTTEHHQFLTFFWYLTFFSIYFWSCFSPTLSQSSPLAHT